MPVTFHLVRHGQGFHNLSRENEQIQDPGLTLLGEQQCKALKEEFPHHDKLTCFVASPLRRTVSACMLAFTPSSSTPIIALPDLREVGDVPCDTGSDPETLRKEFGDLLNLDRVTAGWNSASKWVSWQVKLERLQQQAIAARKALSQLSQSLGEDAHVAVVTHGAFLHLLTDDYFGIKSNDITGWKNTEFRSYHFSHTETGEERLVETEESWTRRNGNMQRPSHLEQPDLAASYHRQLEPFLAPGS